ELHDRTGDGAGRRIPPFRPKDPQEVVEHGATDEIGHDIDGRTISRSLDGCNKVALPARDDSLGADCLDRLFLAGADHGIGNGATRSAELDEAGPHTT